MRSHKLSGTQTLCRPGFQPGMVAVEPLIQRRGDQKERPAGEAIAEAAIRMAYLRPALRNLRAVPADPRRQREAERRRSEGRRRRRARDHHRARQGAGHNCALAGAVERLERRGVRCQIEDLPEGAQRSSVSQHRRAGARSECGGLRPCRAGSRRRFSRCSQAAGPRVQSARTRP